MSTWSIMLRLLLVAVLVWNGAATALAATSVPMSHALHVDGPPLRANAKVPPPCHQQDQEAIASPAPYGMDTSGQGPLASAYPDPDCCDPGRCQCPCGQNAQAAVLPMHVMAAVIERADSAGPMPPSHAAPALPDLIRPPIG